MSFDLPEQPLVQSLKEFGARTGHLGFYRSDAVAGLQAASLKGDFSPDAALRILVDGTGLLVRYTAPDAFVIDRAETEQTDTVGFFGALQKGVRAAFCRDALIRPGSYRVAIRFRVGGDGGIVAPALLDSSGESDRDSSILRALQNVRLPLVPVDQDAMFVMLVLPESSATFSDCQPE